MAVLSSSDTPWRYILQFSLKIKTEKEQLLFEEVLTRIELKRSRSSNLTLRFRQWNSSFAKVSKKYILEKLWQICRK